jgi:tetratricopeptide (TPR) repeat protein
MAKRSKRNTTVVRAADVNERDWRWALILIIAVIATYLPIWWAGYNWDDDLVLTANPVIVGPLGLKEIWTTNAADICPLTLTVFWLENALWGLEPLPYHVVNVLLHAADAVLLWRVLRVLSIPGAWLGATLWALHPVQVESVAWIAEMKNTQSALFYLLSILFFVKSLGKEGGTRPAGWNWDYVLTLVFAAMAMASKSSTVVLPIVLLLCAWWMKRRWDGRAAIRVLPILLMSVVTGLVSLWTQGFYFAAAGNAIDMPSWSQRIAIAGDAVWFYLGKLLWPSPLIAVYPRWQVDAQQWTSYLPAAAVVLVLAILWRYRRTWSRAWFFAFAYFLIALLPAVGLALNTYFNLSFVADHFQYLAAMGPLALAGAGMIRLMDQMAFARWWLRVGFGVGVLLLFAIVSWQRAGVYQNQEMLWTDTLAKNSACWLGHNNLGNWLRSEGRYDEGMAQLEEALRLSPGFADAHANLGNAYFQKGRIEDALAQYKAALKINPDFANAHYNFGIVLNQQGRWPEAIEHFQRAVEIEPGFAEAHNGLGIVYARENRIGDATAQFEEALQVRPGYADAQANLARMKSLATPGPK